MRKNHPRAALWFLAEPDYPDRIRVTRYGFSRLSLEASLSDKKGYTTLYMPYADKNANQNAEVTADRRSIRRCMNWKGLRVVVESVITGNRRLQGRAISMVSAFTVESGPLSNCPNIRSSASRAPDYRYR